MTEFKQEDRVKMKYFDGYATGKVTIVAEKTCKVLFDGPFDLPYDYYPKEDLELDGNYHPLWNDGVVK